MITPKPCPFCGGSSVSCHEGSTFRWIVACCDECGAQAREVRKQTHGPGTPEAWWGIAEINAIAAWNERK